MEVVTLSDLAPILAAVVGPMLAVMLAMMRYLNVGIIKIRDRIDESDRENRELIRENRELIEKSTQESRELIRENRELIEKNHAELTGSLGEVRERLSYIEGYLRQIRPPPSDGDAQAA